MTFTAALFDLDGTLLDSLDDLADSMNEALVSLGHAPHAVSAYRYFVGDGVEALAERALPAAAADPPHVRECVARMRAVYETRWKAKSRPYPEIPALLDELAARGLTLSVLSNKPDDFTQKIVRELFGAWRWSVVRGARPGVPKKPDPAGAIAVARELGVAPEAVLYFGDTNTDMNTARAAGMFAVGCTWGFRPASELREAGATVLVDSPLDCLRLLSAR